jgi:hypothetical protein
MLHRVFSSATRRASSAIESSHSSQTATQNQRLIKRMRHYSRFELSAFLFVVIALATTSLVVVIANYTIVTAVGTPESNGLNDRSHAISR